jgi:AMMECR1 domain-containing protein
MLETAVRRCFSSLRTGITKDIEVRGCLGLTHKPYPIRFARKASAIGAKAVFGSNLLL